MPSLTAQQSSCSVFVRECEAADVQWPMLSVLPMVLHMIHCHARDLFFGRKHRRRVEEGRPAPRRYYGLLCCMKVYVLCLIFAREAFRCGASRRTRMRLREEEEEEVVGRETREVMGRVILRLASSLRPPPPLSRPSDMESYIAQGNSSWVMRL